MKRINILLILIFLTSCGFKLIDRNSMINFNVIEINTSGENKINYFIKNKLKILTNTNREILVKINLNTKKDKLVKEKNIKNTITKYEIKLFTTVEFEILETNKSGTFNVSKTGDYTVMKRKTETLIREKNLTEILSNKIATEVIDELIMLINDI